MIEKKDKEAGYIELSRPPETEIREKQAPAKACPKCKGSHNERDCTKFMLKEEKQGSMSPQSIKSDPQIEKSETRVKEKWNSMDENNNVDKDTEKSVEEQNTFFKKKNKKQGSEVPPGFEPKGPITILQRRHYASVPISSQIPQG